MKPRSWKAYGVFNFNTLYGTFNRRRDAKSYLAEKTCADPAKLKRYMRRGIFTIVPVRIVLDKPAKRKP